MTPQLLMEGEDRVFALGDITNLKENKMASHVNGELRVAEANIRAVAMGRTPPKTLQGEDRELDDGGLLGQSRGSRLRLADRRHSCCLAEPEA